MSTALKKTIDGATSAIGKIDELFKIKEKEILTI